MTTVSSVIEVFESESQRILWVPSITLGYVFTLSGVYLDFWLAVIAVGGARLFNDILDSELVKETDDGRRMHPEAVTALNQGSGMIKNLLLMTVALLYVVAVGYGGWRLYLHFTHTNPILVGLGGVWWGIAIVVVLNL